MREEMELDPVPWREDDEQRKAQGLQSWRELNEEIHQKLKKKKKITRIEWVLVWVLIGICGLVLLEIVEWIRWLLPI